MSRISHVQISRHNKGNKVYFCRAGKAGKGFTPSQASVNRLKDALQREDVSPEIYLPESDSGLIITYFLGYDRKAPPKAKASQPLSPNMMFALNTFAVHNPDVFIKRHPDHFAITINKSSSYLISRVEQVAGIPENTHHGAAYVTLVYEIEKEASRV